MCLACSYFSEKTGKAIIKNSCEKIMANDVFLKREAKVFMRLFSSRKKCFFGGSYRFFL